MTTKLPLLRRALIALAVGTIAVGTAACDPKPDEAPAAPPPEAPAPEPVFVYAPAPAPAPPPPSASSEADQLVSLVNAYRAANGMAGLSQAGDATSKAQQHSSDMAAQGGLSHSSSLASGMQNDWTALGENVGLGGSVGQIESMFEASSPHRANLLNAAYTQIGVGVAWGGDGQLYVTEVFVAR